MKTKFKTAKKYKGGRLREKPQAFPVRITQRKKPTILYKAKSVRSVMRKTELSKETLAEEKKLLAAGFKGWMIGVKYKDGTTEQIPIIARTYQGALRKARPKMNQIASQIDEIVIVDPSLGEVLHKIGTGAVRVAKAIGKGVWRGVKGAARLTKRIAEKAVEVAEERRQKKIEEAAAKEGLAFTGESPLTVTREEALAEEEIPAFVRPGIPTVVRRKGVKVTVEVDE